MSSASPINTNEQVRLNPILFFGATALILSAAIGLPFSAVLILFMFGLYKAMRADCESLPGRVRAGLAAAN